MEQRKFLMHDPSAQGLDGELSVGQSIVWLLCVT